MAETGPTTEQPQQTAWTQDAVDRLLEGVQQRREQLTTQRGPRLPLPNIRGVVGGVKNRVGGWFRGREEVLQETVQDESITEAEEEPEETAPEPRRRRFENLVVEGLRTGIRRWWENVNPRNVIQHFRERDWIWMAGFGVGVAETAAVAYLPPVLNTYARAGINFAVISGGHLALNIARGAMEARARRQFVGASQGSYQALDEYITRQERIAERFGEGHERLKKFGLGLSSGVTYTSLGVITFNYPMEGILSGIPQEAPTAPEAPAPEVKTPEVSQPGIQLPNPLEGIGNILGQVKSNLPLVGEQAPQAAPPITEAPQPAPPSAPSAEVPPQAPPPSEAIVSPPAVEQTAVQERIIKLSANPDWQTQVSAEVGTQLKITDEVINQSLAKTGKSFSDLDPVSLEKARLALQHALEAKANSSFNTAMENIISSNPDADLSAAVEEGQNAFREALSQSDTLDQLAEVGQKAIEDQLKVEEVLANRVINQLNADPTLFTEQVISRGTTVGHILQESGYNITWGSQDAKVFGAHIAANYDLLTNMWERMADARFIPQEVFPVSISELSDLVDKAELGDAEALRKLKQALHWIPAGEKFMALSKIGIGKALEALV